MGTFGERLQREREMRGITLEEIAEATKIGTRSLRALEQQDFDKLPGGIFNKGFVRAYSKYLGIDEDQAVADYMNALTEAQATTKSKGSEPDLPTIEETVPERDPVRIPWGFLIIIALVAAVGFAARSYYSKYGWAKLRREATPPVQAARPSPTPATPVPQPPTPAAETNPATPSDAPEKQSSSGTAAIVPASAAGTGASQAGAGPDQGASNLSDSFSVKVRAKEKSYVVLQADEVDVFRGNLDVGSEKELHGTRMVLVYTSNAGGIEVSYKDQIQPPLGTGKEKKTAVFTPKGMRVITPRSVQ